MILIGKIKNKMESKIDYEYYTAIKHVELWKNQRDLNQNLVDTIVNDQFDYYKKYKYFTFPGVLVIVRQHSKDYLIDGQHRFNALRILYNKYRQDIKVAVQLYQCDDSSHIDEIYSMVNHINTNNCMVVEGRIAPEGEKLRQIKIKLKQQYGNKIWDDIKVTKPYVNTKLLDEKLKESKYLNKYTVDQIIAKIKEQNDHYAVTLKDINKEEYEKMVALGGFMLQCQTPKAKWVLHLFD